MKTTKNSLLVLIMFSALTSFAAGNGDTDSAGHQIADPVIRDALQELKRPSSPRLQPTKKTKYIGFAAAKRGLEVLLINIDQELQLARQSRSRDVFYAAALSASKKLVDFTNQTVPKDIFNNAEVEQMRGIDEFAEQIRMQLIGNSMFPGF